MTKFPTYGFVVFCLIFSGCKKDAEYTNVREDVFKTPLLPEELYDYSSETAPQHFIDDPVLQLFGTFEGGNGITDEGATLGRVLFYDKALSSDNTVSCSSCHDQQHAFSDPNRFSEGVNGTTSRNSMAIFNMRLNRRFFWDTRANSIQQQVLMPIQDELEMNMPLDQLEEKLAQIDYYPGLFEAAFGDAEINSGRIATALAMFVRSITSYNSPYDEGRQNGFANFTAEEQAGHDLYMSGDFRCNHCHTTVNFGTSTALNSGLDEVFVDLGQGGVTGNEEDMGQFKTVSLRNVALTAPYMHDGRFESLSEVLDFYSTGVNSHPNLDDRLTEGFIPGGTPIQFNFTEEQKAQLIAFLETLSDPVLVNDPKYSDPFDY